MPKTLEEYTEEIVRDCIRPGVAPSGIRARARRVLKEIARDQRHRCAEAIAEHFHPDYDAAPDDTASEAHRIVLNAPGPEAPHA